MTFTDKQELIVEKASEIIKSSKNVIKNDFTRFNTIYIGNIDEDKVNFEIQLMYPERAKLLGYDLDRFFSDIYYNFEKTFEYRIWHYNNVPDDLPFIGLYEMEYGVYTFEYSLLGLDTKWIPNDYPALGSPIISDENDIKKLGLPDYSSAGYMPKIIENFHKLNEDLKGRINVGLRKFFHGPYQVAKDLRGLSNLYMDTFNNQKLLKEIMEFGSKFHEGWISFWEELMGQNYGMVNLGEDEIDSKIAIPPQIYKELILPYHINFGKKYESIHFHSCGNINDILEDISEIPNLKLVEVGPGTDILKAAKVFKGKGVSLYKCPDPVSEILQPEANKQEKLINDVIEASEIVPVKLLVETPELEPALKLLEKFRRVNGQ